MIENRYYKQFRKETRSKILKFIDSGTSLSILGTPGIGKSDFLNYISSECDKKGSHIICISLNVNDIVTISELNFFRHLLSILTEKIREKYPDSELLEKTISSVESKESSTDALTVFSAIKKLLSLLTKTESENIGIFIDGFIKLKELETPFFNSLCALRAVNKFRISLIFIDDFDLSRSYTRSHIGDLYDLITNNIFWMSLPNRKEAMKIIDNCAQLFNCKLNSNQKDFILNMTKGHAALTKFLTLYICENNGKDLDINKIIKNTPIKTRTEKILTILKPEEIKVMSMIAQGKNHLNELTEHSRAINHLIMYTLINQKTDDSLEIFSPILKEYVLQRKSPSKINSSQSHSSKNRGVIEIKKGNVFVKSKRIDSDLTKTEFEILSFLISNINKVVSRDMIAEIMWKEKAPEKYSDWAIDRSISRLRKKIGDNAYKPQYIKTLRGRGFKLIS